MEPSPSRTSYVWIWRDAADEWRHWNTSRGVVLVSQMLGIPLAAVFWQYALFGWSNTGPWQTFTVGVCGALTVALVRFLVFLFLAPFRRLHRAEDELHGSRQVVSAMANHDADKKRWATALHFASTVLPRMPRIRTTLNNIAVRDGFPHALSELNRLIAEWHAEAALACPEAAESLLRPDGDLPLEGFNLEVLASIMDVSEAGFEAIKETAQKRLAEPTSPKHI